MVAERMIGKFGKNVVSLLTQSDGERTVQRPDDYRPHSDTQSRWIRVGVIARSRAIDETGTAETTNLYHNRRHFAALQRNTREPCWRWVAGLGQFRDHASRLLFISAILGLFRWQSEGDPTSP